MPESKQPTSAESKGGESQLTPDRFVIGLLALVGLCFLSEQFEWFAFNEKKGWTVLIALAVVAFSILCLCVWIIASRIFARQLRYTIKGLLTLILAVAIPLAWFAVSLQQAKSLSIGGIEISQEATNRFKAALPACEVVR